MLPLGRESRDVLQMIQEFNARLNAARQDRNRLAKELLNHQNRLAVMSIILEKDFDGDAMFARCKQLEDSQRELHGREAFIDELERLQTLAAFYQEGIAACNQEPIIDVELTGTAARESRISELERLQKLEVIYRESRDKIERQVLIDVELMADPQMESDIRQLESLQGRKKALLPILDVKPFDPLPELHDLAAIIESGQQLKKLRAQVEALSKIKDVIPFEAVEITDHTEAETLITSVETLQARLVRGNTLINANKALQEELDREYAQVIEELGGICPTCDQPFGVHQHG
jgi:hypothetical protein